MSDNQRIRGLSGIKPSRMPVSAAAEIPVSEAEKRLGIQQEGFAADSSPSSVAIPSAGPQAISHASNTAGMHESLPSSLLNRKPREITVSRTFRLPLPLVEDLEAVAKIHEIPMVTILAEALQLHLARFPRS